MLQRVKEISVLQPVSSHSIQNDAVQRHGSGGCAAGNPTRGCGSWGLGTSDVLGDPAGPTGRAARYSAPVLLESGVKLSGAGNKPAAIASCIQRCNRSVSLLSIPAPRGGQLLQVPLIGRSVPANPCGQQVSPCELLWSAGQSL